MPRFEVAIFNQEVCDLLAKGDSHKLYDDEWAELHFIEVSAENEEQVRAQLLNRYPANEGFVIDSVDEIEASKFE